MSRSHLPEFNIGALIADCSRMLRRAFNERFMSRKLTQAQWRALAHLAREQGLNQVKLAERLDVQPITVARLIDKLVASGLVMRQSDPNDRRAQKLYLTAEAAPLLEQIWGIADELFNDAFAGFSPEEQVLLSNLLMRLNNNLLAMNSRHPPVRSIYDSAPQ